MPVGDGFATEIATTLCPRCSHVVTVSGGPRFLVIHEHTPAGDELAFVVDADAPRCPGSGEWVPRHRIQPRAE